MSLLNDEKWRCDIYILTRLYVLKNYLNKFVSITTRLLVDEHFEHGTSNFYCVNDLIGLGAKNFFFKFISHTQTITIHYIYNSLQVTVIVIGCQEI